MTDIRRPRLGQWSGRQASLGGNHIIIFVHGILSDSTTFDALLNNIASLDERRDFDFWVFDYDYNQNLFVSADQLANSIVHRSFGSRRVDIVGHSMGGLVARFAILRHLLPNVARIVTLATPNHGTVRGAQLNMLGQLTTLAFRQVRPLYARAPGILDLTNAHHQIKAELRAMDRADRSRLDGKSYVSIPAQYFNGTRQLGEAPPSATMGGVHMIRLLSKQLTPFR